VTDLRPAVEKAVLAEVDQAGVVSEFVVVASVQAFGDDGDDLTAVVMLPDGGSAHRILGLLEHARLSIRADILDG
jgi:hypothetical protein